MLEWEIDREGLQVPKWNGRLLASKVDSKKEARRWADRYEERMRDVNAVFVLGIGGGQHLLELRHRYPSCLIIAIDALQEIESEFKRREDFTELGIVTFAAIKGVHLFDHESVRDALSSSYIVLKYAPSLQTSPDYYSDIENWILGRDSRTFQYHLQVRPKLKRVLEQAEIKAFRSESVTPIRNRPLITIHDIADGLKNSEGHLEKESMIWMALRELVK